MASAMSQKMSRPDSNIEEMVHTLKMPQQLLKFGASGKPGFRNFFISPDLKELRWESNKKAAEKTRIMISDVKQIQFGQRTEKFKRNNRPDLEPYSFSLFYVDGEKPGLETLDLVGKDEDEFQMWTTVLTALTEGKLDITKLSGAPSSTKCKMHVQGILDSNRREAFKNPTDVYAFGWGEWGQNGFGLETGSQVTPRFMETLLGKGVVQAACGWSFTSVLLENGSVWQYGNKVGTGFFAEACKPQPTTITEKTGVKFIACGHHHTAALTSEGRVLTWGNNLRGQLGHGNNNDVNEPKVVESLQASVTGQDVFIVDIACGAQGTACLTEDGHLYTWGCGEHGFLGHNQTSDEHTPKVVKDLAGTDIVLIAAGDSHMFACTDVETFAWGWNGAGQLGLGHEEDQLRPTLVDAIRGARVAAISAGAGHSACIALSPGAPLSQLFTWGCNTNGQLGHGKKKRLLKPTVVGGTLQNVSVVEVQCGAFHTLIRSDGRGAESSVWSCGYNKFGQLGQNTTADVDEFRKLTVGLKGKEIKLMSAGGQHSAVCVARQWVEDKEAKECMGCKAPFTFTNRKHHCRNCYGVFCSSCSRYKAAILRSYNTEPVRVCGACYTKVSGRT